MVSEIAIIKEVAKRLTDNGIAYMFTGPVAANFYAVPRMTQDVDIFVELDESGAERVYSVFQEDFYIDKNMLLEAIRRNGPFNVIHYESVFKIDFIIRKGDPYRLEEFGRRRKILFEGMTLYVVAPEDLVLSKLYWAKDTMSELQLNDVKNLFGAVTEKDTHPAMERLFREMMMKKTGEERIKMGFGMYSLARRSIRAAILQDNAEVSEDEIRALLFERCYGDVLPA
jgi:hypothetical protein